MQLMVFLLLCLLIVIEAHDGPQLKIEDGLIIGKYLKSQKNRTFSAFRGIPYARPPLRELRFEPPVLPIPWEDVLDATNSKDVCPQIDIYRNNMLVGNEDCLYLNVYTPQVLGSFDKLLPVMFFIHGGAQKYWSGIYEEFGPELFMDKDIVLVVLNYRLGALGFLSTGDKVVPGNNGLKDQNLALKWVKRNIEVFGGDPNRITLFGESSGGMNVQLHMMSPLSRGLIHGGISQSGTASSMSIVSEGDARIVKTRKLAGLVNCTVESNEAMVDCLRKVPALEIAKQDVHFVVWNRMPLRTFLPVVEPNITGAFLIQHPIDVYKAGLTANIPYMVGFNSDEGAFHASGVFGNPQHVKELNDDFNRIAPITLAYSGLTSNVDLISKSIKAFYFKNSTIDDSPQSKASVSKMYSDSWRVQIGSDNSAFLHTKFTNKPVYYYVFGYRAHSSFTEILGDPSYNYGVSHGDELIHLFKVGVLSNYKPTKSDSLMTETMLTLWTNFAETGNPNVPSNSKLNGEWKPFSPDTSFKIYYIKDFANISMIEEPFPNRFNFWNKLPIKYKGYLNNF